MQVAIVNVYICHNQMKVTLSTPSLSNKRGLNNTVSTVHFTIYKFHLLNYKLYVYVTLYK